MSKQEKIDHTDMPSDVLMQLARWLQSILQEPPVEGDSILLAEKEGTDHITLYRQLPDLIQAQLKGDQEAPIRYAPLLFHLVGCEACHQEYLHLYDALGFATQSNTPQATTRQPRRWECNMNGLQRMLGHLCRTLIQQAEFTLRQSAAQQEYRLDEARSLLQLAIRVSARIREQNRRSEALHDLVRVATLLDTASGPDAQYAEEHGQTASFTSAGRERVRTVRSVIPMTATSRQTHLQLRSGQGEGAITQDGSTLILHLRNFGEIFRGRDVTISVLLGTLIEPIRWAGGNPRAIRSSTRVSKDGELSLVVGETDLQLAQEEDYHLLEVTFSLLEVHLVTH